MVLGTARSSCYSFFWQRTEKENEKTEKEESTAAFCFVSCDVVNDDHEGSHDEHDRNANCCDVKKKLCWSW